MALFARWRLRAAVGMLAVGVLVGVASRALDGDPAKGIHVRWDAECDRRRASSAGSTVFTPRGNGAKTARSGTTCWTTPRRTSRR